MAELVGVACQRLTAANVPHNLFIADCGARIFLFPNCFAEKKARGQIPEGVLTQLRPCTASRLDYQINEGGQELELLKSVFPPPALLADVLETQVDPAAWEIAGHIVLKRQQDYDAVTQEGAWRLLELASASEERFAEVAHLALEGLL